MPSLADVLSTDSVSLVLTAAVEAESHDGKRKTESVWPIFRIHHQRSRYIWEMYSKKHAISRELYDFCIKEGHAGEQLIPMVPWSHLDDDYVSLHSLHADGTQST